MPDAHDRWLHRLACLLVCTTFPLLWVGGLVTTYDAGMAVPDWPTTYGYNLFLYPWQTWIFGPWNLFIEHGHRLLGAAVGMLTLLVCACVWWRDKRLWMRFVAIAAVALVIAQGSLGGLRVLANDRAMALIHGCVGPAFFGLCVALAVFTSSLWAAACGHDMPVDLGRIRALSLMTTILAYFQLAIGAHLRHMPPTVEPGRFRVMLYLHLITAGLLLVHVIWLAARTSTIVVGRAPLVRPAYGLLALICVQLLLGCATYVTNYNWPSWTARWGTEGYVVQAKGLLQAHVTTAHMATGSLILGTSLVVSLRSFRLLRSGEAAPTWAGLTTGAI